MVFKNFTPHPITVFDENNNPVETYVSDGLVRAEQKEHIIGNVSVCSASIPVKRVAFFDVVGLPESAEKDEYFIVSSLAAQAARSVNHPLADKLLVPSDPVRNENGQIVGCKSFSII